MANPPKILIEANVIAPKAIIEVKKVGASSKTAIAPIMMMPEIALETLISGA